MPKIAIILGSLRRPGMGLGIANWLVSLVRKGFESTPASSGIPAIDVVFVDPTQAPLPLGPIVDGSHVPADIRDPAQHPNPAVREWATFVASCSGFVILSPVYNHSYPGELKNTFDHLYWEWKNKPVAIISYAGGGGHLEVIDMLRELLGGRLKMQVAKASVAIKWQKGSATAPPAEGPAPAWLRACEPQVYAVVEELKALLCAAAQPKGLGA